MEQLFIKAYLFIYPAYYFARVLAFYYDPQLRVFNHKTRHEAIKEVGAILFSYQTLLWFYFLTIVL